MAIENGTQNVELAYLLDPAFQIEGLNGKPVIGGWLNVYEAGTDTKVITYQDFEGSRNPFNIKLGSDGRAVILADPSITYDVYAFDSYGNQIFSRLNVQCNVPGNISIKGADTRIKNTDGTLDISLQTMGNNVREYTVNTRNKILDVQSPLYFVENSNTATIIGIKGSASGYVTKDYVDSAVSGKLDTTAFSAVSGDFLTDKFEYDDNFNITGYDGSAFASNGQTYSAGTNIDITDNVISVTGLPTSSDVENAISSAVTNVENKFEYNENNYITAYNNSAFAGTNYSAGDYVNIENDTISVTGLQPSGDYATHDDLTAYQPSGDYATKTELESATSGKMDVTGMTAYQPTGDYATHDDLTAYQEKGDYLSASESANFYPMTGNPSGFLTNDAITGLQPSGDYVTHDEMTAYQPTGDYATHDDLTAYATTSLVSSVSSELYSAISGISGDFELVAGSGVELVDDPNAKTTTINVTAEGTPVTAIQAMIESATSGLQPSGDYATTAEVAEKLDTTAFSKVSGDFLTAHQDLSDYATTADLTGKQDAGDYLSASESANYYPMTGNPSGFLTELPAGTMNESEFEYDANNKISAYNGSAFAAGGGVVPEGVMAESGLEFNGDNEISGYNGSAFAAGGYTPSNVFILSAGSGVDIIDDQINKVTTISVTSQAGNPDVEAYVQNTSADIDATIINVSSNSGVWGGSALPISAGPGIKFDIVDDTLIASTSGYVWQSALLFHTDTPVTQTTYTLSHDCSNYDKLEVDFYDVNSWRTVMECTIPANLDASGTRGGYFSVVAASTATGASIWFKAFNWTAAGTTWSCYCSELAGQGGSTNQTINANQPDNPPKVINIIGWKRVGGN